MVKKDNESLIKGYTYFIIIFLIVVISLIGFLFLISAGISFLSGAGNIFNKWKMAGYIPDFNTIVSPIIQIKNTLEKTWDMILNPQKYMLQDTDAQKDVESFKYKYEVSLIPTITNTLEYPATIYTQGENAGYFVSPTELTLTYVFKYIQKEGSSANFICWIPEDSYVKGDISTYPKYTDISPIDSKTITCIIKNLHLREDLDPTSFSVAYMKVYVNATFLGSSSTEYRSIIVPNTVFNRVLISQSGDIYSYLKINRYDYEVAVYRGLDQAHVGISREGSENRVPIIINLDSNDILTIPYKISFLNTGNGYLKSIKNFEIVLPNFVGIYDQNSKSCKYTGTFYLSPFNIKINCKTSNNMLKCEGSVSSNVLQDMNNVGTHTVILLVCIEPSKLKQLFENREFIELPITVNEKFYYTLQASNTIRFYNTNLESSQ